MKEFTLPHPTQKIHFKKVLELHGEIQLLLFAPWKNETICPVVKYTFQQMEDWDTRTTEDNLPLPTLPPTNPPNPLPPTPSPQPPPPPAPPSCGPVLHFGGGQSREDVPAPDDPIAPNVEQAEGDAEPPVRARADLQRRVGQPASSNQTAKQPQVVVWGGFEQQVAGGGLLFRGVSGKQVARGGEGVVVTSQPASQQNQLAKQRD